MSNAISHQSFKEFEIEFLVQDMTESGKEKTMKKAEKGGDVELYDYNLRDIVLKEDGGAVLVAEQFFVRIMAHTYTDANGVMHTNTYKKYFFNDIIVVNVDEQGEIMWANKIPKRQATVDDGGYFSSYTMAVVKDKLYFVFNDNPKNLSAYKEGKPAVFYGTKDAVAVLLEVSMDGNIRKQALFTGKDAGALARPLVCEQVSPEEMVIFCQYRKSHRFARLSFL